MFSYLYFKKESRFMGNFFGRLFSKLWSKKELKIIIIGLDNSGKTTILSKHLNYLDKLHLNEVKQTVPSIHPTIKPSGSTWKSCSIKIYSSRSGTWEVKTPFGKFLTMQAILGDVLPQHKRHPLRGG